MKDFITLALSIGLLSQTASAKFEIWKSADGREAQLELIEVSNGEEEKIAVFRMKNGKKVTLLESQLDKKEVARLNQWKPSENASGATSVFDRELDGNLLTLQDGKLKRYQEKVRPNKYYLFYYTASWCPPCQKFTPKLVDFYEKHKNNKDFEIVLITNDESDKDMETYAVNKKMTWPHLKMSKAKNFQSKFKHPGRGIPNLILADLKGELIKTSYVGDKYLGPTKVMKELENMLK